MVSVRDEPLLIATHPRLKLRGLIEAFVKKEVLQLQYFALPRSEERGLIGVGNRGLELRTQAQEVALNLGKRPMAQIQVACDTHAVARR